MKWFLIACMSLSITLGLANLQAHVKFKVSVGPGFENRPEVVSKIEDYLNEKIGKRLGHDAVIYLKVAENLTATRNTNALALYADRSLLTTKGCKPGFFNTAMQEAILTGSTSDTKPYGILFFGNDAMKWFHKDEDGQPLSPELELVIKHEVTHGLGIYSGIQQSTASCDPIPDAECKVEALDYFQQVASLFEVNLNEAELKEFCENTVKKRCPNTWTTFDMHIVDSKRRPIINKATLHYQGIDLCSLNEDERAETEFFFDGKTSGKVRLNTHKDTSLSHIHPEFPFDDAIMVPAPDPCGDTDWNHFEVKMLKDLGYNVNTPGIKRPPVYASKSLVDARIFVRLANCQSSSNRRQSHLLWDGTYALGHLTNDSHIILDITHFNPLRFETISLPFKEIGQSKTLNIEINNIPRQLQITIQHPYQGQNAYFIELKLL